MRMLYLQPSRAKTTVENNLMAGNEQSQAKFVQEHGKDVLSCSDNPTSASCQRGEAVNKAIAGALATGGVASLTAPAQAMWMLGAGLTQLLSTPMMVR